MQEIFLRFLKCGVAKIFCGATFVATNFINTQSLKSSLRFTRSKNILICVSVIYVIYCKILIQIEGKAKTGNFMKFMNSNV